jgi:hypothetical protein
MTPSRKKKKSDGDEPWCKLDHIFVNVLAFLTLSWTLLDPRDLLESEILHLIRTFSCLVPIMIPL